MLNNEIYIDIIMCAMRKFPCWPDFVLIHSSQLFFSNSHTTWVSR